MTDATTNPADRIAQIDAQIEEAQRQLAALPPSDRRNPYDRSGSPNSHQELAALQLTFSEYEALG